jgi:hypothetical protein
MHEINLRAFGRCEAMGFARSPVKLSLDDVMGFVSHNYLAHVAMTLVRNAWPARFRSTGGTAQFPFVSVPPAQYRFPNESTRN